MKKYLALFLIMFISSSLSAQLLTPPYKITFLKQLNLGGYVKEYVGELDLNGDDNLSVISLYQNNINYIYFSYPNGKIIDAINCANIYEHFGRKYKVIRNSHGDKLIIPHYSSKECQLWLIGMKNHNISVDKLYSLPHRKGALDFGFKYFIIRNKYLLISINTPYPHKHEYRRILAFDLDTFKFLWEIKTADYIFSFFYSKLKPNNFFYTTEAYWNGLTFSNNTLYIQNANDNKYAIDTSFTQNYFSAPDSTAKDYSTDSKSYLVECSLDGHFVKRKKVGNHFEHLLNNKVINDSTVLLVYNSRAKGQKQILEYKILSDKLDTLYSINSHFAGIVFFDNNIIISHKDTISSFKYYSGELTLQHKIILPLGQIQKVHSYYFFISDNIVVTDSSFQVVAKYPNNKNFSTAGFSKAFNAYYFSNPGENQTSFFKLEKLTLFERLSDETVRYLLGSTIVIIFILLILWTLTMVKSRKKVSEQNLLLLEKQAELEETTVKLVQSEKLALLGTVAASFAHKLNSPIGAIINSAERLAEKITDENLDLIIRSADYTKSIVSKFLYAARPDSEVENNCIDFNEIWETWLSLFDIELSKYEIDIITDFSSISSNIKIKRSEFLEILTNLILNAKDAILESKNNEKKITVSAKETDNKIIISISDTGVGLSKEQEEKIFNPFFTSKPIGSGTGLGLWITKNLVKKAGGEISVISNHKGTTFTVILPKC